MIRSCSPTFSYFASIDECISEEIAILPSFALALQRKKVCAGGLILSLEDLEAYRYCTVVNGSLGIHVTESTDLIALFDLRVVTGSIPCHRSQFSCFAGTLTVDGSGVTTLDALVHLTSIGSSGASTMVEGGYSLVITSLLSIFVSLF